MKNVTSELAVKVIASVLTIVMSAGAIVYVSKAVVICLNGGLFQ